MDFKITRRQTISYLTIFKCLLNREPQPYKMRISKANLLLAYPYLLMEGQSCGYEAFNFIKETKMSKFTFEEFLKIFINGRIWIIIYYRNDSALSTFINKFDFNHINHYFFLCKILNILLLTLINHNCKRDFMRILINTNHNNSIYKFPLCNNKLH